MEVLFDNAIHLGTEIQRIITNFNKDSADRKKTSTYFQTRKQQLEKSWEQFDANDRQIKLLPDLPLDHEYFSKDYYKSIAEVVQQYRQIFETALATFQGQKGPEPDPSASDDQAKTSIKQAAVVRRHAATAQALERLLQALDKDAGGQPAQFYQINLATMNQLWDQITDLHYTICEQFGDLQESGYDIEKYIELEGRVQNHRVGLSVAHSEQSNKHRQAATSEAPAIRLPKVTIPKFDGDYLKWRQFFDLFTKMIDSQSLPAVQKMWYLKGNVSGEAERLIRHLSLSEENYETAWKVVQDRYNNLRMLTAALIKNILDQPNIPAENAASAVKALHDTTQEGILALNLGIKTDTWSPLLLHLLVTKLDKQSHIEYERSLTNPREIQSIEDFLKFLEKRFQSLEAVTQKPKSSSVKILSSITISKDSICKMCHSNNHPIFACKQFLQLTAAKRLQFAQKQQLCLNCLKSGHRAITCKSRNCMKCNRRHNTLLHLEEIRITKLEPLDKKITATAVRHPKGDAAEVSSLSSSAPNAVRHHRQQYVLLSTAKVKIIADNMQAVECRAILDSGSQVNLVTERLVKKLGISTSHAELRIEGIGKSVRNAHQRINVEVRSNATLFSTRLEAYVLPNIVSAQPTQYLDISSWDIPDHIVMADPNFNLPERVDILLGAEFYHQLLTNGKIQLGENLPVLQNSVFGWILSGRVDQGQQTPATCAVFSDQEESINNLIERFWKIDDAADQTRVLTAHDKKCLTHFAQHTTKSPDGRFVVKLPFADSPSTLGESRQVAVNRLLALERRLAKNDTIRQQYVSFMNEYEALGHMSRIEPDLLFANHYFIPHHYVLKPDSTTTRLRVVFDASAKTSSGLSLNEILHTGPIVQEDLFTVLLRFRNPIYAFTTDIEKMYRQVWLHTDDRSFQLILYRDDTSKPMVCYQLNTLTYGMRPAQFLATNALKQVAADNKIKYPMASAVLEENFYVDNGLSGFNSLTTAIEVQRQLNELLNRSGLPLRKWCANHPRLLNGIPIEHQEVNLDFDSAEAESIKTLGLIWNPKTDDFRVTARQNVTERATKRTVNSDLARIFDPLGILAPVVVTAKIFVQQLWQQKISWDDPLPVELQESWKRFRVDLNVLKDISFPRHVFAQQIPSSIQIHVFSDASERAYGAAIYLRSTTEDGKIIVRLLCARSRVAPLQRQTLPRLELCAAAVAAELTVRVRRDLRYEDKPTYYWTDSQIVLHWINSSSSAFHTFVANRVAKIQELSLPEQWRHVGTRDNPADCLSRGLAPKQLATWSIWFYGPQVLHGKEAMWPQPFSKHLATQNLDSADDRKPQQQAVVAVNIEEGELIYKINHRNSFATLQRIVAYMYRFFNHARNPSAMRPAQLTLSPKEIDEASGVITRSIQQSDFKNEINQLTKFGEVGKTSPLKNLAPFIDNDRIIRVGGRLEASDLPYDAKHPMLIPYNDPITKILMHSLHIQNRHCGPQTLLAITRQKFWPLKGKTMARSIVQHCVTCSKASPKFYQQLMGQLPDSRVQSARPFINCGVDFCGPFRVHYKIRGKRPHKAYVAVFCCFATKAVHLELVSDLTTNAFIGALKRFIARRGHCQTIYCDNATNFVGASNQLSELFDAIHSESSKDAIVKECTNKRIQFSFIPPRAPHFGGLWEAAVKSAKHLLVRSTSTASLTYEELETVIVEIEAILNSRPLSPMSSNPRDLSALTPGHFLIGEPLTSQVDTRANPSSSSLATRWELVSRLKLGFWKRWSLEYLNELQFRNKWKTKLPNVKLDTMVVIKEDNTPPMQWPLGRIEKVYKGPDGTVRVADVRTARGTIQRAIHRLAPLPVDDPLQPTKRHGPNEELSPMSDDEIKSTNPPRKRNRSTYVPSISTILMILFILPLVIGSPINVIRFGSTPGIHFEGIGSVKIATTDWKLVVYYDLNPLVTQVNILDKGTITLRNLCDTLKQRSTCSSLVKQLEHARAELISDNILLLPRRVKRGAINILGNIAHSLFGVLDSEYEQHMAETIEQVRENENRLLAHLKNQTSFIDSTLNIIKHDQIMTKEKFNQIDEELKQINTDTQNSDTEINQLWISHSLLTLSLQLTMLSSDLRRVQSSLLDILISTHHGMISPVLLSPNQFKEETLKIRANLPSQLQLPVDQENLLSLYRLMTVCGTLANTYLVFTIKLPLVQREIFELFNVIPVPTVVNETLITIKASTSLLAVNMHRDQFFPIREETLNLCSQVKEGEFLCSNILSTYSQGSRMLECEVSLLNKEPATHCEFSTVNKEGQWSQMKHQNQWIFAVKTPARLTAACDAKTLPVTLEGSGMLKLSSECTLRSKSIVIQGQPNISSSTWPSYTGFMNISDVHEAMQARPAAILNATYATQLNKLANLHERLSAEKFLELPNQIQTRSIHHHITGYTALSLSVIIVACWAIRRLRKKIKCDNSAPQPTPRYRPPNDFTVRV